MTTEESIWIYTGLVLSLPAAITFARLSWSKYDDADETGIKVLVTAMIGILIIPFWPFVLGGLLVSSFFWSFYQIVTPGKFELPEFIQDYRRKRRRGLRK